MIKYICLPITNDGDINIMLEIPSIHSLVSNIELYLEIKINTIDT